MALADLTWDDVEVVEVPSYGRFPARSRRRHDRRRRHHYHRGDHARARSECARPRLAQSPARRGRGGPGIVCAKSAPIFEAIDETIGAGVSEDNPATLIAYRYPMITVYAGMSDETAYAATKAVVESFDLYKDANPGMSRWEASIAGVPPTDAPFHPGAIRYLEEIGVWTDEHQAWNDARQERLDAVLAAWDGAMEQALEEQVRGADWQEFWAEYRAEHLD